MSKTIVYAATPFRMENRIEEICDFIEGEGCFPVHPLLLLPRNRYNYDQHSREDIYRVCFGLIELSDELWIFGIGGGSLKEWEHANSRGKLVRSFVKMFDLQWEQYCKMEKYNAERYKEIVQEVLRMSETA